MHRINAPIKAHTVSGRDGTPLRVYECGTGYHRWLLPPGLGTPLLAWKHMIEYFRDNMTIVTWDPRGCFDSGIPEDLDKLRVEDHTDDAVEIANALEWNEGTFVTGGWSMGIEIGLEIYRRIPHRISALTLINGSYEHVLKTAFGFPYASFILRILARMASGASPIFAPATRALLGRDWAVRFLQSLGIVTENEKFFGEVVQEFRKLDFATYFKMIMRTDEHSARSILPLVKVPTLVTAGTMDKMTPMNVSRYISKQIPGSDFFVIPNGTHYTTLEYPEIVNLKLENFFRYRVFGKDWDIRKKP